MACPKVYHCWAVETVVRPVTVTALVEVKNAWWKGAGCPSLEEIGSSRVSVKKMMTNRNAPIAVREGEDRTVASMKSRKRSRVCRLNPTGPFGW